MPNKGMPLEFVKLGMVLSVVHDGLDEYDIKVLINFKNSIDEEIILLDILRIDF